MRPSDITARLERAHAKVCEAKRHFAREVKECLTAGTVVHYKHGNHWRTVEVIEPSEHGGRLLVRNVWTERTYRVSPMKFV